MTCGNKWNKTINSFSHSNYVNFCYLVWQNSRILGTHQKWGQFQLVRTDKSESNRWVRALFKHFQTSNSLFENAFHRMFENKRLNSDTEEASTHFYFGFEGVFAHFVHFDWAFLLIICIFIRFFPLFAWIFLFTLWNFPRWIFEFPPNTWEKRKRISSEKHLFTWTKEK